jgi:hypothetical protein
MLVVVATVLGRHLPGLALWAIVLAILTILAGVEAAEARRGEDAGGGEARPPADRHAAVV